MPHLLVVDDDCAVRQILDELARESGFSVAQAGSIKEALIEWERKPPDLVLIDLCLPDGQGMEILRRVSTDGVEIVVITGHSSVDSAVDALRSGVADYLTKPIALDSLQPIFSRIAGAAHRNISNQPFHESGRFGKMWGNSPPMQALFERISRVAPTDATVFLVGESGTGKELVAQAIHELSARREQPFMAVNCGAISPNLIESELFGHEKGSFTGAERQHKGYFERAHGGTLFLDEITEMPLDLQVKLLRVLETGCFMRVGTNREIHCDSRIIAATNRNPELAVQHGSLRADLYYRLNVFPLELPPLRERGDDVLLLADQLLALLNQEHDTHKYFSSHTLEEMQRYDWPGNVRELKNFVHRAYILSEADELHVDALLPQQLPPNIERAASTQVNVPVGTTLAEVDRLLILATLQRCGGVKSQAAAMLGISAKTLYNRLEAYSQAEFHPCCKCARRLRTRSVGLWLK